MYSTFCVIKNMKKPYQINSIELIPKLDDLLIHLLEGLSNQDWEKQTVAPKWKIKDVAVHLLDGNLRTLSMLRDRYYGEKPENINSYSDLVEYLNRLNADWIKATRRLSPKVIVELLKTSGTEYYEFLKTLNPNDKAEFSVAWAGESESKNWFHIAREYTEKWHHQQQIRFALGEDKTLLDEKLYHPYLDTSVRALPFHYRDTKGNKGETIKFTFKGNTDKNWFLLFNENWELFTELDNNPDCEVIIQNEIAWRIFTKGINRKEAIQQSEIIGNREIGLKIFDMIAVMA